MSDQNTNENSEKQSIQSDMDSIAQQVAFMKSETLKARQNTLASIRSGIQDAMKNGLHQTLFPNANTMNQENTENTQPADQPIDSGTQAMKYTDSHITNMLSQVQSTVNNAMKQALNATATAGKPDDGPAAQQGAQSSTKDNTPTNQTSSIQEALTQTEQEVEKSMTEAQQAVSNAVNQMKQAYTSGQQAAPNQQGDSNSPEQPNT